MDFLGVKKFGLIRTSPSLIPLSTPTWGVKCHHSTNKQYFVVNNGNISFVLTHTRLLSVGTQASCYWSSLGVTLVGHQHREHFRLISHVQGVVGRRYLLLYPSHDSSSHDSIHAEWVRVMIKCLIGSMNLCLSWL